MKDNILQIEVKDTTASAQVRFVKLDLGDVKMEVFKPDLFNQLSTEDMINELITRNELKPAEIEFTTLNDVHDSDIIKELEQRGINFVVFPSNLELNIKEKHKIDEILETINNSSCNEINQQYLILRKMFGMLSHQTKEELKESIIEYLDTVPQNH